MVGGLAIAILLENSSGSFEFWVATARFAEQSLVFSRLFVAGAPGSTEFLLGVFRGISGVSALMERSAGTWFWTYVVC